MRSRLRAAVMALLADPDLDGAADSARLAVVVLAAKTSAADLTASVTAGELGRWLGVSHSAVCREVRPRLQRGPVSSVDAEAEPAPGGESGRTAGIRWMVEALRRARHEGGLDDPLRLTRPEFAVLLRLIEALFGPGWRTGHGAATDRLALLLLVLSARPDGTVRLCAGAVDGRGRLAAWEALRLSAWWLSSSPAVAVPLARRPVRVRGGLGVGR